MDLVDIEMREPVRPIHDVAEDIGIATEEIEYYGRFMAKIRLSTMQRLQSSPNGEVILVTAMTPTKYGEGKTTISIGLNDALNRLGRRALVVLREPSLGPMFGAKGVGTGGGRARVLPTLDINLHFTGDLYAIAAANNLLAAVVDNHIYRGNRLLIDPNKVVWRRCLDVSDRELRHAVIGVGQDAGITRSERFIISAASEVMAILCLAKDLGDLKWRLGRAVVAYTYEGGAVRAGDLGVQDAMTLLLKDAIKPNLVQTVEGNPALVHGGPFANIAHGTASLVSIQMARHLGDFAVVEAGFGSELGAEKFFNIVARMGGFDVKAAVIVASIRALKCQGGKRMRDLIIPDPEAVEKGLFNLAKHVENIRLHGVRPVVALNVFESDTEEEIDVVRSFSRGSKVRFALCDAYSTGSEGALDLARHVMDACEEGGDFRFLYELEGGIEEKIRTIVSSMYGMNHVDFTRRARERITAFERMGFGDLPICMAKTQFSLSNDPKVRGVPPDDMPCTIVDLTVSAGAGFVVAYTENVNLMPGLPPCPIASRIKIEDDGTVEGIDL